MSGTYKLFEMTSEPLSEDKAGDPITSVNTLGEAVATLELRAADPSATTNRFLIQKNDEPLLTLEEARARLKSEDNIDLSPT